MSHYLYKHFDANGLLLYVGITNNPRTRHLGHKRDSEWFYLSRRFVCFKRETKAECEHEEMLAIQNEKPLYNIQYKNNNKDIDIASVQIKMNIRRAIKRSGKTLDQLASELNVNRSAIGHWQSHKQTMLPLMTRLPEFCNACGVSIESIFLGVESMRHLKRADTA